MLLMKLYYYRYIISTSRGLEDGRIAAWSRSPMSLTQFIPILHRARSYFVSKWRNIFATSGANASTKEVMSILVY